MRHKDANLHLTKHPRLDRAQLMRHKDANFWLRNAALASKKQLSIRSIETSLHF